MSVNVVALTGNIVRDAELSKTQSSSTPVLNFTIAVNDRRYDGASGQWCDYVNFFDLNVFGKRAKALEKLCLKGTKVAVRGKLRQNTWEKDGQKRSRVTIVVDEVEFFSPISSKIDDISDLDE